MRSEPLKGHLDALLLAVLARGPLHGYAGIEELGRRSDGALALPEGPDIRPCTGACGVRAALRSPTPDQRLDS